MVQTVLLTLLVCVLVTNNAFVAMFWRQHQLQSRSALSMSVSVGGGGAPPSPPPKKQQGFIISPRLDAFEAEMMILDNFNQIQQGEQRKIGIIGSQGCDDKHKQMVELLSYALVLSGNHVVTSGGGNGTNFAVIKGALRACNPDLLTVLLPQTMLEQPAELQPFLSRVGNLVEQPEFVNMDFKEAVNLCNENMKNIVDELLVFCYHDSKTILSTVQDVEDRMDVTIFYLD